MDASSPSPPAPAQPLPGRRSFLQYLTGGLGAVAALALTVPFVGYLLGLRKRPIDWVGLGAVDDFQPGETRLVTFDNPLRQPWDGVTAQTGVYVRSLGKVDDKDQFLI